MAKPKSGSGTRIPAVAIELLESDHRNVDALFKKYEQEKDGDEETKRALAERICGELTAHAQLEEEIFYPWLRDNLEEDEMEMVEEAQVEHNGAKDLIAQIEAASTVDETYDAKVKVLGEYIKHHVKEEEEEIFPAVRDKKEELDALGQEMAARKVELLEDLGLAEEEDSGAGRSRPGKTGQASAQRGSR